jgi:hypothetical protein
MPQDPAFQEFLRWWKHKPDDASWWHFWKYECAPLVYSCLIWWAFILFGAGIEMTLEKNAVTADQIQWNFGNAVYWAVITSCTVGYGDMLPRTPGGRVFYVIWSFVAIIAMGWMVANICSRIAQFFRCLQPHSRGKRRAYFGLFIRHFTLICYFLMVSVTWVAFAGIFVALERRGGGNKDTLPPAYVNGTLRTQDAPELEEFSWTYGNSLYYCYTTFTTIGYGDFYPRSGPGRFFAVWLTLVGVVAIGVVIDDLKNRLSDADPHGVEPDWKLELAEKLSEMPAQDAEAILQDVLRHAEAIRASAAP